MKHFLLALAVSACSINVDYTGTSYQCDPDGSCPTGFTCENKQCVPTDPVPPACSKEVAAGGQHACAVRSDGNVFCWGRNDFGQLGDGSTTDSTVPVQVKNLGNAVAVAAGGTHTCALDSGGTVSCWGHNDQGQLGDGTAGDARIPTKAMLPVKATSIAVGDEHTCALGSDGALYCWGSNDHGELGDNTNAKRNTPGAVAAVTGAVQVSAGDDTTCIVDNAGSLYCWGDNGSGQVGDGTTTDQKLPVKIDLPMVAKVAAGGGFTCAVTVPGAVYCWGNDTDGQIGIGTRIDGGNFPTPQQVLLPVPVHDLMAGGGHACARDENARLWCWGYDGDARIGDGTTVGFQTVPVMSLVPFTQKFSAGGEFTCALDRSGAIRCMGFNRRGALGDGRRTTQGTPQRVPGVFGATAITAGGSHTCALIAGGVAECWGSNDNGQLGDGSLLDSGDPVEVAGLSNLVAIQAGDTETCALDMNHLVFCWGENSSGQLGQGVTGPNSPVSQWAPDLGTPSAIAVGDASTCAVASGMATCAGNQYGPTPVAPPGGFSNIKQLSVGGGHSCALLSDGSAQCWGSDSNGQLGNGSTGGSGGPLVPPGFASGVMQIAARGDVTCGLFSDGSAKCMGYGSDCGLGNGMCAYNNPNPLAISGLSGAAQLSLGFGNSCARRSDGGVMCWGAGYNGSVGDGQYQTQSMAVQLQSLSGVMQVAAGGGHACALMGDGTVECWGLDLEGQLGDGITMSRHPVAVQMPCPD